MGKEKHTLGAYNWSFSFCSDASARDAKWNKRSKKVDVNDIVFLGCGIEKSANALFVVSYIYIFLLPYDRSDAKFKYITCKQHRWIPSFILYSIFELAIEHYTKTLIRFETKGICYVKFSSRQIIAWLFLYDLGITPGIFRRCQASSRINYA